MAIYHLHVKSVSRGAGGALAKADYITREGKYQADRDEVIHSEHGHMPKWSEDAPKEYWEKADIYERANGRLFVQVEFALPVELTKSQRIEIAVDFCRKLAKTSQGQKLPYSLAVHKGRGENNPHCHLMINERINDEIDRRPSDWFRRFNPGNPVEGGAPKAGELRSKLWLQNIRVLWAETANAALKKYGHETEIDHRTLAAQGIDREPQYHLGPAAAAMERKNRGKAKTGRGSEYREKQELAKLEKEIEMLKQQKTQIASLNQKIENGRVDVRAKFEQWKASGRGLEKDAESGLEKQPENFTKDPGPRSKPRGGYSR